LDLFVDAKIDQLPICGQPLADTFHALFQTVPLQKLFPLFPHSTRIAKSCCHWFGYKSIPWMLWDLSSDGGQTFDPMLRLGTNGTIDSTEDGGGGEAMRGAEVAE
jgi:hypothetical protein